jgi:hypothetical protein
VKRFILSIGLVAAMAASGSACIIVDDSPDCYEGEADCASEWEIEECHHGRWHIVDDCDYDCGGYCDYDRGEPVCFCPP